MAGALTVAGMAAGLLTGEKIIGPVTMIGSKTVGAITDLALAAGDNTVPVPAGAAAALLVIPSGTTAVLKVRTDLNPGDGGLPVGSKGYLVLPVAAGVGELIIHATDVGSVEVSFI